MKKYEGRIVGILGTVIIHLIAGIIFMSFRISSVRNDLKEEFEIEIVAIEEPLPEEEKIIELPATTIENVLRDNQEMLNIARNLANRPEEKIDPEDYIDKVKEELIESGQLDRENYIDEWRNRNQQDESEEPDFPEESIDEEEDASESQKMAADYQGPTRIYYDLSNRYHTYLPIPVYKCQGSGKVTLGIEVNQRGVVEKAQIIESQSTTGDECLIETAVNTALISRFNPDINAPKIQRGTLTYHFVAQ